MFGLKFALVGPNRLRSEGLYTYRFFIFIPLRFRLVGTALKILNRLTQKSARKSEITGRPLEK